MVLEYLQELPNKHNIHTITMDMWQPYRDSVYRAKILYSEDIQKIKKPKYYRSHFVSEKVIFNTKVRITRSFRKR